MKSSIIYGEKEMPRGYVLLAVMDESESYEVDISEIYYDQLNKNFVLMTASGCSCWSGEYEIQQYDNLDDIEKGLLERDEKEYLYTPSFKGGEELVKLAKEEWDKIKNTYESN